VNILHSILIVDDSFIIRRSLRLWIEQATQCTVCGEAENGQVAIDKVQQLQPDVVIMDFQMPVMNGLEASRGILLRFPDTAIVMFTLHPSDELMHAALQAGVRDVVSKTDRLSDHLSSAIHQIFA
jgi:DNA-binding NarL/FixJ family response regulator